MREVITFLEDMPQKFYYVFIFIFSFSFLFFHLHNLPVQFYSSDDLMFVEEAKETPYMTYLSYLFILRDPSLVHTCTYETCVYLRPGQSFIWKVLYDIMGFNINIFHSVRVLAVVGITIIIFYFLNLSTHKKIIALLGSLFYVTLPPLFSATWFWGDTEIFAEFFWIVSLLCFYNLVRIHEESKNKNTKKIVFLFLFTLFFILAFRSKETAKINIGVIFLLVILLYRSLIVWVSVPFLIIFYYIFPNGIGGYITSFSFTAIYNRIIASAGGDYAPEIPTFLSPMLHFKQVPVAMLSQVGFFLGYFVILSFIYLLFTMEKVSTIKRIIYKIRERKVEQKEFILYTSIIWLSITIIVSGFFSVAVEHRYFAVGLIPFTLILFLGINKVINSITNIKHKYWYIICFFVLVLFVIGINAFHISYHIRGGTIGYPKGNYDAAKYLLSQENNKEYKNEEFSFILFDWFHKNDKYLETIYINTLNRTFFSGNNHAALRKIGEFNETMIADNIIYFVNHNRNETPIAFAEDIYEVNYVTAFGGCFDDSMYCLFKNKFIIPKKTHFIYSVTKK